MPKLLSFFNILKSQKINFIYTNFTGKTYLSLHIAFLSQTLLFGPQAPKSLHPLLSPHSLCLSTQPLSTQLLRLTLIPLPHSTHFRIPSGVKLIELFQAQTSLPITSP